MTIDTQDIKNKILAAALNEVAFEGWTQSVLMDATEKAGYKPDMAVAVFPEGVTDLVAYFSEWADAQMLAQLAKIDPEDLRVRARVAKAAMIRFEILAPHKEALREAAKFWARPFRSLRAKQVIWQTADHIWTWAGDTATDYNRYTKRGLLFGVLTTTTLYWLSKNEASLEEVETFLRARIENVLKIGQAGSKIGASIGSAKALFETFPFKKFFQN